MAKPTNTPLRSPLVSAFNNIVNINRSKSTMRSTQNSYNEFLRFMNVEVKNIESIKLPDEKQVRKLSNLNVASTFGSAGSLLSSLASGALDAAGLVGNFFGGGKDKAKANKAGKPIPKGKGIRLGGLKALGVANVLFAGLDFATGLAEGESTGKAAAGAGGALAGSLLGGAIGQALIPVPGLGFVIGSMAGNFLGGYLGDRGYESATGGDKVKEKVKARLKEQEKKQKLEAAATQITLPQVLDKFDNVVTEFQRAVDRGLLGPTSSETAGEAGNEDPYEPDMQSADNTNQNSGELGDYSVSGGDLPSSKRGSPFGPRGGRNHNGIDYLVSAGTPISVVQPGTVSVADSNYDPGGWGALVEVQHADGSTTRYAHLSKITVSAGQKIEPGTMIGLSGGVPGAPGAGNSRGEHLHFEYLPKGGGPSDPAAGNNDDKFFRFGGNVTVKPKVKSQTGVMGAPGGPTAVLMAGTNDYGDPKGGAAGVKQAIKALQDKGYNVVVVPPSEVGQTAEVSKAVQQAAAEMGATVKKGQYKQKDNSGAIPYAHLTDKSAAEIASQYKGATFVGDSNATMIPGAKIAETSARASKIAKRINEEISSVGPAKQSQVQGLSQQQVALQSLQQYPSYNTSQNSVTFIPMMMGGGGGSQQRPMVVSSGGGGNQTTIMPPVPEGQVLNSLFKAMLLTNLSGS
jgi:murein DD-endopeptidase MepM/ murein hydrolase activator NlpD